MKKHRMPPSPLRKGVSWKQFIQAHLKVTWTADLFTGDLEFFWAGHLLHFSSIWARAGCFAGCTPQPKARWMQQQARNFSPLVENASQPSYLIHARHGVFFPLDQVLRSAKATLNDWKEWQKWMC